ncbi:MAG: amidohydrolase family protein [Phycisphaerae bacterium]|jgi:hypothetical protein|nr:amidohydrolase family protein [Phycisphaerae bacterium]
MNSVLREFVMKHALFSHHDHHCSFADFEKNRAEYTHKALLGYAAADLVTAAGPRPLAYAHDDARLEALWPSIRTTGYGRAVVLGCEELFRLEYTPANFAPITEALQASIADKTPAEVYDYFVKEKANIQWVAQDGLFRISNAEPLQTDQYPDYYQFAFRIDDLFAISGPEPLNALERFTGIPVLSLDRLVVSLNAAIDRFRDTGRMNAFKVGIAYLRDLTVTDPPRHEAEQAFSRIRNRKAFYGGNQQNNAAVNQHEARALSDYMLHRLLERADDENIPLQIHTGYLAGNWGSLAGTKASFLIPLFEKYRRVRFDVFHGSWPWTSELGAIAKNYPNVYPDLCWAWTMNPEETERTLCEWLDGVPFNKIFAFGADTGLPWCDVGYATQARRGIARVLEEKVRKGFFSESTAEEVASAIMLKNGEQFYGIT